MTIELTGEDILIVALILLCFVVLLLTGLGLWMQQPQPPILPPSDTHMWESSTTTTTYVQPDVDKEDT